MTTATSSPLRAAGRIAAVLTTMLLVGAAPLRQGDSDPRELAFGRACEAVALTMVARLDLTTFPNSTGPRRAAGQRTPAQYGFTQVTGFDDGWAQAAAPDGSWQVSIFVLDDHPRRKRLCFVDTATNGGTYSSTEAIDVVPGDRGLWRAIRVAGPVAGCGG